MNNNNYEYDFEHAPCGYMSFTADGKILHLNQTLQNWLSLSEGGVIKEMNFSEITPKGTSLYFQMFVYPTLRMQGYINELSVNLIASDKSVVTCLFNASVRKTPDGNLERVDAILFRIEERKRYEAEIFRAKESAEAILEHKESVLQSQRRIMSILGHDTKAPIFSVNRLLKMVVDGTMQQHEVFPYFELMATQLDATLVLIDNLLHWANAHLAPTKTTLKPQPLFTLCREVFTLLQSNADAKKLSLNMDVDESILVWRNQTMVSFILRNLVNNAIKFTASGGITVSVTRSDDDVSITISDTGVGMNSQQLQKYEAGELQSSAGTAQEDGSGLGMLLIHEFLLQLNGSLFAESVPGRGSDITVLLPISSFVESPHQE